MGLEKATVFVGKTHSSLKNFMSFHCNSHIMKPGGSINMRDYPIAIHKKHQASIRVVTEWTEP